MAYASLANVNAVIGLYTSFFPTITYAIFGTSKHITLGEQLQSISLILSHLILFISSKYRRMESKTVSSIDSFCPEPAKESAHLIAITAVCIRVTLYGTSKVAVMSVLQLHFITSYLSDPLVGGFTTGAACHVFASQVPKLVGVSLRPRQGLFKLPYALISLISIGMLMVGKLLINPSVQRRYHVPIPFELFVMICGIAITHSLKLHEKYGVAIVVTVSVGKVFAKKHNYQITASQELRALALCQIIGGLMSCHPASGSLSRAAVNSQMGVRSESPIDRDVQLLQLIWLVSFFGTFMANAVTLGQMHDTELYRDVRRYRNAEIASNIAIYRYDAPLLFLNNDRFKSRAIRMVDQKFSNFAVNSKCQLYDIISEHLFFPSIHDALLYAKAHQTKSQPSNRRLIRSDLAPKKADLHS
uniref:SLC26A/SulP transporter domain-containing protein n=1 Tax=Parascaris equorum TaxID=6256 RepID=A0A914RZA6_PAREQ